MAHLWARWLHNPCRVSGLECFAGGKKSRGGPQESRVPKQPLPPSESSLLQSGRKIGGGPQVGCVAK